MSWCVALDTKGLFVLMAEIINRMMLCFLYILVYIDVVKFWSKYPICDLVKQVFCG